MNKDKIALIKYILLMVVVSILPLLEVILFLLMAIISNAESNETFILLLVLFLIIPIIYILSSILITRFAIKNHWSKYLDKFFDNKKLTTLIFFLSIIIIYFYYISDSLIWSYLWFCFAPTYIIVYITIIFNVLKKNFTRKDVS